MGRDKLLLEVGGATLVERVAGALSPRCEEVILAGRETAPPGVRAVADSRVGEGPLAGMEAGLAAARHPLVFVAAGDMPFLSPELVDHLLRVLQVRGPLATVPEDGRGRHPLCAAYSRDRVLPPLRSALDGGARAAREFLRGLDGVFYVPVAELRSLGDPDLLLMNVNSPEDLARARGLVGA
jgi:molybdopterin-guanine dinucleotide biosynthesis protein A